MIIRFAASATLLTLVASEAWATPPLLSSDADERIYSKNRQFFAEASADRTAMVVFRRHKPNDQELYRVGSWHPNSFLSDDGDYFTAGNIGNNLLELTCTLDETMLIFYRRGSIIKTIRLGEIIGDLRALPRSPSHYLWGHYQGHVSLHRFGVDTVEGHRLTFDVTTGNQVKSQYLKELRRPPR